jgi:pachytene checkpoint protein 2
LNLLLLECPFPQIEPSQAVFQLHVYLPQQAQGQEDLMTEGHGDEAVVSGSITELPCTQWEGLWDSLIYPHGTKEKLLNYIYSTFLLSDAGVDCKNSHLQKSCI